MPRGLKRGAALSQLSTAPNEGLSVKRLCFDQDRIEFVDNTQSSMQTVFRVTTSGPPKPVPAAISSPPIATSSEAQCNNPPQDSPGNHSKPKQPHKPPSQDFVDSATLLIMLLIMHEYDPDIETPCSCGKGVRTVQCQDCQEYELSCQDCWISNHLSNPWHWARVWKGSFFVRSNISTLRERYAVQLGHHGKACPTLDEPKPVKFTVTHSNGVHGTYISFCNCGRGSRVEQLMRARLFPASVAEPETAFTFTVMREYDLQSLQGKIAAYDYFLSLRRLTDNVHTDQVNVSYAHVLIYHSSNVSTLTIPGSLPAVHACSTRMEVLQSTDTPWRDFQFE